MITLDQVSKQYKSSARPALDNISVKIDKGEFVFLIGPSGSGKSTFMRLLLAEEHPSSGDIRVSKSSTSWPGVTSRACVRSSAACSRISGS
jgi:cell division transport system ATP-binding protein